MTEASDRIYEEVGEDADIIWGTVVDEPTFIRRKEAAGESTGATYRGCKGIIFHAPIHPA